MNRLIYGVVVGAVIGTAAIGTAAQGTMSTDRMPKDKVSNHNTVMVGGAAMYPTKDIVDNAMNSKDHTMLVTAVKAAGLVDTLKGPGPFTVFAPTNTAFEALARRHH
jgi:uncharacterized surface protein with fasciclin (FAS1) repeats